MYVICLATDYDGTLAHDGVGRLATRSTRSSASSARAAGSSSSRGASFPTSDEVCPRLDLFDRVVAENGALLFDPATKQERRPLPEPSLVIRRPLLRRRASRRCRSGARSSPPGSRTKAAVLEAIRDLGLELQITFNKGAVMVLPPASTRRADSRRRSTTSASRRTTSSRSATRRTTTPSCRRGFAVAVANALPAVKEEADLVTTATRGAGVAELIGRLLEKRRRRLRAVQGARARRGGGPAGRDAGLSSARTGRAR